LNTSAKEYAASRQTIKPIEKYENITEGNSDYQEYQFIWDCRFAGNSCLFSG
jgi:hypothetical protein